MVRTTVLRLGGVAAAVFALAGAVNGTAATNQPDLSSRAAIESYLTSIGVDPASMTWQQGVNNYAGPSCPGVGWTCTTDTNVVQIAPAGGQNDAECMGHSQGTTTPTHDDQTCMVVQSAAGGQNTAKCEEHSSDPIVVQECTVMQDNTAGGNHADVLQDNTATTGDDATGQQDAEQFAHVMQNADGGDNHSDVHQSVSQSLTFGLTQHQDGHQAVFIDQGAEANGNFSHVHETQDQQASGGSTQEQNTEFPAPSITVGTDAFSFDCGTEKPANPNQCANVMQQEDTSGTGGTNGSQLDQAIGERQTTNVSDPTQVQGTDTSGQQGDIHQVNPPDLGQNMDVAHQALAQRQSSPTGVTRLNDHSQQTDPGCCGASEIGGAKNSEDINQATTQSATDPTTFESSSFFGEVHQTPTVPDAPTQSETTGNNTCDIDQHGRNDSGAGHFSVNGNGAQCIALTLTGACVSGGVDAPTQPVTNGPCTFLVGPPDGVDLPPLVSLPTTPTYGQDIPMPDYGTPTDYLAAIGG